MPSRDKVYAFIENCTFCERVPMRTKMDPRPTVVEALVRFTIPSEGETHIITLKAQITGSPRGDRSALRRVEQWVSMVKKAASGAAIIKKGGVIKT